MPSFVTCTLLATVGGFLLSAISLLMSGAGHSPYGEILIPLINLGVVIMSVSAIAFVIAVIARFVNKRTMRNE